jgi:hypothetical protein
MVVGSLVAAVGHVSQSIDEREQIFLQHAGESNENCNIATEFFLPTIFHYYFFCFVRDTKVVLLLLYTNKMKK